MVADFSNGFVLAAAIAKSLYCYTLAYGYGQCPDLDVG
ncbi:MAG: hypothetical protein ACJA0M_002213 [Chitinophagales bacterium]|jgi:hypothetical protein